MSSWPLRKIITGKTPFPPESPRQCPYGHVHISWANGDDYVFCWDCNRGYALDACFQPEDRSLSESEESND